MLETIYADTDVGMSALFGRPSAALEQRMRQDTDNFITRTTGVASHIAERVGARYHDFSQGTFARRVNSIRASFNQAWKTDSVRTLSTIEDVQHTPDAMRHFVMAHPGLRKLNQHNRIDGFNERYVDSSPTGIGKTHHDYRVATSGVVVKEKVDGKESLRLTQYFERKVPDYQLTINNKAALQVTYATITQLLTEGVIDPTSVNNALLG